MQPDERLSRRGGRFREGTRVTLADGSRWTFPEARRGDAETFPNRGPLLAAIVEADGDGDRGLAELALAIHLLHANYDLEPWEFQRLLCFTPGSGRESDWHAALAEIVAEHVRAAAAGLAPAPRTPSRPHPLPKAPGLFTRWFGRWSPLLFPRR